MKVVENEALASEALRSEQFDVISVNGQMSEMNGCEATRRIRKAEAGEKKH